MVDRLRRFCRGHDLALGYAVVVTVIAVALAIVPRSVHDEVVLQSSTNLINLRHHPTSVLIMSAFVLGSPAELAEIPLLIWAHGALQRWLGRGAAVITGAFGHVGATLFVAALLAAGITRGRVSPAVGHFADVGGQLRLGSGGRPVHASGTPTLENRIPHRLDRATGQRPGAHPHLHRCGARHCLLHRYQPRGTRVSRAPERTPTASPR